MNAGSVGMLVTATVIGLLLIGVLVFSGRRSGFGRLPGDIRYNGKGMRVYVPLTSMLLLSLVLSLLLYLFGRFF